MKILMIAGIMLAVTCCLDGRGGNRRSACVADQDKPWSYRGRNGPKHWGEKYPDCNLSNQSPIKINVNKLEKDPNLKHLEMTNYDVEVLRAEILNDGYTVKITPNDDVDRTIEVNNGTFKLLHLQFHFGDVFYRGSEHVIQGRRYSMEAQFVHINENDDLAIVAVLYEETLKTNNTGFTPITEVLPQVLYKDDRANLRSPINLSQLLPRLPAQFYRYRGSLTMPGCTEGVTWSVLKEIKSIEHKQLKLFRNLFSATMETATPKCKLSNNYRPVQPLNERKVTVST